MKPVRRKSGILPWNLLYTQNKLYSCMTLLKLYSVICSALFLLHKNSINLKVNTIKYKTHNGKQLFINFCPSKRKKCWNQKSSYTPLRIKACYCSFRFSTIFKGRLPRQPLAVRVLYRH